MTATTDFPEHFNVADYFINPNLAGARGGKPYLLCGDQRLTYRQLHEQTNRVGNVLQGLGVEPENRVMLLMLDTPSLPPCFWGAVRIGAVAVPINTMLKSGEYR